MHPHEPERLLANQAWMRRLAASLVREAGEADGVVQEAWVAALEARGPITDRSRPSGGCARPWRAWCSRARPGAEGRFELHDVPFSAALAVTGDHIERTEFGSVRRGGL